MVEIGGYKEVELRPLPNISLRESVDSVLNGLDKENKIAVVAIADGEKARLAAFYNIGSGFSFMGYLDKPYHGKLVYGAQLQWVHK